MVVQITGGAPARPRTLLESICPIIKYIQAKRLSFSGRYSGISLGFRNGIGKGRQLQTFGLDLADAAKCAQIKFKPARIIKLRHQADKR